MTLDQFERLLDGFGERIEGLDARLQEFFTEKVDEIRRNAPVAPEDGGALRSSIKLTGDRFHFDISMLYYGVFQNYGVLGVNSSRQPTFVPEAGLNIEGFGITQEKFQFGTNNFWKGGPPWGAYYTGIRAQSFFSITDITNELTQFIADNTIE
jgi:hypothetical protein